MMETIMSDYGTEEIQDILYDTCNTNVQVFYGKRLNIFISRCIETEVRACRNRY